MYTSIDICLAVLGGLWVGGAIGVIAGGINRSAKHATPNEVFQVPAPHREVEHEAEAEGHCPRQYH
jgi:hypothetical protein